MKNSIILAALVLCLPTGFQAVGAKKKAAEKVTCRQSPEAYDDRMA